MVHAAVTDRAEQEVAVPPGTNHQQAGVLGDVNQHPGRVALLNLPPNLRWALVAVHVGQRLVQTGFAAHALSGRPCARASLAAHRNAATEPGEPSIPTTMGRSARALGPSVRDTAAAELVIATPSGQRNGAGNRSGADRHSDHLAGRPGPLEPLVP